MDGLHRPVLLDEVRDALQIQEDGLYVDGTFGRGGHAAAILEGLHVRGRLLAFDKDPEALAFAADRFNNESRLILRRGSFGNLGSVVTELGWQGKVDGILLDLGVSSPQLDDASRGFSFLNEGPLDIADGSAVRRLRQGLAGRCQCGGDCRRAVALR